MSVQIYRHMPFDEYRRLPGVNQSLLKEGMRSPAHMKYAIDNPKDATGAMDQGSAFHCLTTEPDEFGKRFAVGGPVNERTGKPYGRDTQKFAEWAEQNAAAKTLLTDEQYDNARGMAMAIRKLPDVADILSMPKLDIELVIQWTDDDTGVLCKCRLDVLLYYTSPAIILDLKSTQDARPGPFAGSCLKFGYFIQAAFYLDAVSVAFGIPADEILFLFACAESSEPYCAALYRVDDRALEWGRFQYDELLRAYKRCTEAGEWPGYPTDLQTLYLPKRAEGRE